MNEFTIKPTRLQRLGYALGAILAWIAVLSLLPLSCMAMEHGCGAGSEGIEAVEKSGFRDVQLDGRAWMACSQHDSFTSHFTATNAQGQRVSGVVCCGFLKSCTVRF